MVLRERKRDNVGGKTDRFDVGRDSRHDFIDRL